MNKFWRAVDLAIYGVLVTQSVGDWVERWRVLSSSPGCRPNLERCAGGRTASEHCQGTLEQGTKPLNTQGACLEHSTLTLSPLPQCICMCFQKLNVFVIINKCITEFSLAELIKNRFFNVNLMDKIIYV